MVSDASVEEQRTLDFGRLERRLKTLFPNSQVAIIPVGTQVLVRGQAYDGEEAQNILQIVRAEVFSSIGRNNDFDRKRDHEPFPIFFSREIDAACILRVGQRMLFNHIILLQQLRFVLDIMRDIA